jgi:hypothetical protein
MVGAESREEEKEGEALGEWVEGNLLVEVVAGLAPPVFGRRRGRFRPLQPGNGDAACRKEGA